MDSSLERHVELVEAALTAVDTFLHSFPLHIPLEVSLESPEEKQYFVELVQYFLEQHEVQMSLGLSVVEDVLEVSKCEAEKSDSAAQSPQERGFDTVATLSGR
jgi:hypothetical protein